MSKVLSMLKVWQMGSGKIPSNVFNLLYQRVSILFFGGFLLCSNQVHVDNTAQNALIPIDTLNSFITWKIMNHHGKVKIKKGAIAYRNKQLTYLSVVLDMNAIYNEDLENATLKGTLENVLKSEEFFHTKKYPEGSFYLHTSEWITDSLYNITGDIHLLRNDICMDFIAHITKRNDSIIFESKEIPFDRTDWGIYYLSSHNPNPKKEEESFQVLDTIKIQVKIKAAIK